MRANPELTARRSAVKFCDFWGLERELVAGADRGWFGPLSRRDDVNKIPAKSLCRTRYNLLRYREFPLPTVR